MPRVLIVDDEKSIRETLKEILLYESYEVEEAEDGKKAFDLIKKFNYDAVLCGYQDARNGWHRTTR